MRKRHALLITVATALAMGGSAGAKKQLSLFPLADGNRWTLRDVESDAVTTISVRRQSGAYVLRGFPGTSDLRVRMVDKTLQAWDPDDRRWEALLRFGARVNTKYPVGLRSTALWQSVLAVVASKTAVVRDADGKALRGCTKFTFRAGKLYDAGIEEMVFAPGIGPVRIVEQTIAGPREKTLESFRTAA